MASALAGQLGQLAAAKAADDRAATGVAGGRASLLYTAAQAADVDLTTISSIGLSGFKQLQKLEKRFAQFEKTLFNASAVNLDRSSMTADAIAKLDSSVESFLRLLCPFFLMAPAFQALELLIRRFKVHLHNVDALVLCGLPYHSTQEFVKLVQICYLEPGSTWEFLRGMKATGAPMPRPALASRLVKDPALFRVVASMGADKQTSSRACTFQAVVLCEALAQLRSIEEDTVSLLAPHLLAGMDSGASQDRRAAAYMITGALSARVAFSHELLDTLLVRTCRISESALVPQTLLLLVAMAKTQLGLSRLPDAAFKLLVKQPDLGLHLSRLANKGNGQMMAPLLRLLLPPLTTSAVSAHINYAITLEDVMRLLPPGVLKPHAAAVAKQLLEFVCDSGDNLASAQFGDRAEVLARIIRLLDTRAPEELDAAVNTALGAKAKATRKALKAAAKEAKQTGVETDAGKKAEESLQQSTEFLQRALHGSIRAPMSSSGASLATAVYSQVPAVRASALQSLDQACVAEDAAADAEAFAQSMALQSLSDDSAEVVRAALGLKCLLRCPPEAALQAASSALEKARRGMASDSSEDSGAAAQEILEWLCGDFAEANSSRKTGARVAGLLADFLLLPPSAVEVQKCATKLAGKSSNAFLAALKGGKSTKGTKAGIPTPLASLAKALSHPEALESARSLASAGSHGCRQLVVAALAHAVCTDGSAGPASELVRMATDILSKPESPAEAASDTMELQADGIPSADDLLRLVADPGASTCALARGALLRACGNLTPATWEKVEAALARGAHMEEPTALCAALSAVSVGVPRQEASPAHLELPRALLGAALPAESRALWMARAASASAGTGLTTSGQRLVLEVLGATLSEMACAAAEGGAALKKATASAEAMCLGSLLPPLIAACTHADQAVRRVAGKVATALSSLAETAGESVLSLGAEGPGSGLSPGQTAAVLLLLRREAASIERDPVALENALRAALRNGKAGEKKQQGTELGPKGAEALQAFLLGQLSGCLESEGPAVGQLALRCLRGGSGCKQLLAAAVDCLHQMPGAKAQTSPGPNTKKEVELGAELIAEFAASAVQEAKSAAIVVPCLKALLLPARLPPSHADLRAAAASACSPELMLLAKEAAPEAHGPLLHTLMAMAAGDLHAECQSAARAALGELEVTSDDLLPLLQAGDQGKRGPARSAKRAKGAAGAAQAPATSEPCEHTVMVLELLQWKRGVVGAMALVPVLAALLAGHVAQLEEAQPLAVEAAATTMASSAGSGLAKEYEALFGVDASAEDDAENGTGAGSTAGSGDSAYLRQLLLLSLALLLEEAEGQGGQAELVDVGVVVQAAQLSHDPAERASALRLLGLLAAAAPEGTLKNVFEVVNAAKSAAAGDSEAWSLASATLAAVVPAWMASGRHLEELLKGTVEMLSDLDPPRRAPLLQAILGALPQDGKESEQALQIVLLLLLRQVVKARQQPAGFESSMAEDEPEGFDDVIWLADLASSLAKAAEPAQRLLAFGGLLTNLPTVALAAGGAKPSRSLQRLLVTFVTEQLQHMKLQTGAKVDHDALLTVLQSGLASVQALGRQLPELSAGKKKTALEALIDSTCSCVAALEGLVDTPAYISALVSLASSGGSSVDTTSRSLRLLAEKVASVSAEAAELREDNAETAATRAEFASVAKASIGLCSADCQSLLGKGSPPATQQSYLTALGVASEAFGQLKHKELLGAAPAVIRALSAESPVAVRGTALITLGRMARGLGAQLVPLLPSLVGPLVSALSAAVDVLAKSADEGSDSEEEEDDELSAEDAAVEAGAVMATVSALLDGPLAPFLARHIGELLPLLLHPAVLAAQGSLPEQARASRSLMAERIPPRLLLSGLAAMLEETLARGQGPVAALVETMEEAVDSLDSAAAALHAEEVFVFILRCMDIRRQRLPGFPDQDALDAIVMKGLVGLVMKLSEARFKPLFLRLMEWASSTPQDAGSCSARTIMLFSAAEALGSRLRSVFVPYFTYLLDAAVGSLRPSDQLAEAEPAVAPPSTKKRRKGSKQSAPVAEQSLDPSPEMEVEGWLLKYKAVSALHVCFEHDTVGFLEPERFTRLLPVVAAQIEATPSSAAMAAITAAAKASGQMHGPEGASSSALGTLGWAVVDCLTAMAIASGSDEHWRPLNHAVLMSARSDSARTKLTALEVVASLVKRLAEEYLTLLPEAIPFLAELLEDPNQDVESRAQELVKELEGLAGESLDPFMKAG